MSALINLILLFKLLFLFCNLNLLLIDPLYQVSLVLLVFLNFALDFSDFTIDLILLIGWNGILFIPDVEHAGVDLSETSSVDLDKVMEQLGVWHSVPNVICYKELLNLLDIGLQLLHQTLVHLSFINFLCYLFECSLLEALELGHGLLLLALKLL